MQLSVFAEYALENPLSAPCPHVNDIVIRVPILLIFFAAYVEFFPESFLDFLYESFSLNFASRLAMQA